MRKKDLLVEITEQWNSILAELPSGRKMFLIMFVALALLGIAQCQEKREVEWERTCPGVMNVAPKETIYFSIGDSLYQVRHNGLPLFGTRGSSVSYALINNDLKTRFGGTIYSNFKTKWQFCWD